jgi:glutaredoxin
MMLKVYVRKSCPFCKKLLDLLKRENVEFEEIDISLDKESSKNIVSRAGHTPVPQVEYNGKIIFDYDSEENLVNEIKGWF